jgi:hypothetical protein
MFSTSRRKACIACVGAKRRCDLRRPTCGRCIIKGIGCRYEAVYLNMAHSIVEFQPSAINNNETTHNLNGTQSPDPEILSPCSSMFLSSKGECFHSTGHASSGDEDREFFLTAESWQISSFYVEHPTCFSIESHQRFISNISSCLRQWVTEGKTLFIHRQLYRDGTPRIMQDVYTTCAAYLTKNKANESMILQIIEERAAQLIEEQDLVEESHHLNSLSSVLDHLARVQALLIYQIIRLFDGNISQSGEAERQIPKLFRWAAQMWGYARLSSELVRTMDPGTRPQELVEVTTWRAWILAESVRRTWLFVNIVQCLYQGLKWESVKWPGSVMFTAGAGLWDAPSASSWWKTLRVRKLLFLPATECGRLFTEARADEVDDFARFQLHLVHGSEKVEIWLDKNAEENSIPIQ